MCLWGRSQVGHDSYRRNKQGDCEMSTEHLVLLVLLIILLEGFCIIKILNAIEGRLIDLREREESHE